MSIKYDILAPAKINLFLQVIGIRNDGYHLLRTALSLINLYDKIILELREDGKIVREFVNVPIPEHLDLTIRAASLLKNYTGVKLGVNISLNKSIPIGAGLGGGSSDAASVLIALNKLWNTKLPKYDLMKLATKIGADVPFFIFGRSAFAEGIGEVLYRIKIPKKRYLIIYPNIVVKTSDVFDAFSLKNKLKHAKLKKFMSCRNYLFGRNDLEPIVLSAFPIIKELVHVFRRKGFCLRMSGSGSCFYIEYNTFDDVILAEKEVNNIIRSAGGVFKDLELLVKVCAGIDAHPLQKWIAN